MSITALVWLIAYVGGGILSFYHPMYGLMAYFLTYYQLPKLRWWGKDLPDMRWSLMISLAWIAGYLFRHRSLPPLKVKTHPQSKWLVLFVVNAFIVSLTTAVWEEKTWETTVELLKFCVLYFLIIGTIRTNKDFSQAIYTHIAGLFTWGWVAFTNPKRAAGRLIGVGGADSFNDNLTAAVLVAILPCIGSAFLSGGKWVKGACSIAGAFVLNTLILCNSRGSMLGLAMEGLLALKIATGQMRRNILLVMIAGGVLFVLLMDPQFIERQKFGEEYGTDNSATGRLATWKGALDLIADHPFGVGGGGFKHLSPIYIPDVVEAHGGKRRTAHNTYLLALADWGIQGFIFIAAFILSTFYELYDIRKRVPNTETGKKIWIHSMAITLGFLGLLTAGIFTSRLMAEVLYWLPALSAALKNLQVIESEQSEQVGELARL